MTKSYKKTKLIFNSYLAKQLVLNGFQIIDLIKRLDELDLKKYDYNMSRFEYDFYSKSLEKIYDCIDDVEE